MATDSYSENQTETMKAGEPILNIEGVTKVKIHEVMNFTENLTIRSFKLILLVQF